MVFGREHLADAELQKERSKSFHLLGNSMIVLGCVCTAGAFSSGTLTPTKWIPAVELHPGTSDFAALGLPRGHFGFIATPDGIIPQNQTTRLQNLVDCDAAGQGHFTAPCYPLLHFFVRGIAFFTIVAPLIPVLVAMFTAFRSHSDVRRTCAGGKRAQRSMVYVGAVILLQVIVFAKRRFEHAAHVSFDPSDTIFAFFSVAAIGMREVAHLEVSKEKGAGAIKGTVIFFGCMMCYYVFWTARYFHKPLESLSGAIMGISFALLFHTSTTTERALDTSTGFMSRPPPVQPLLG